MTESIRIWHVTAPRGNWYDVFATSSQEAIKIVADLHYDGDSEGVSATLIPLNAKMLVNTDSGQKCKSAKAWARNQNPGPFISNTYEDP